MGAANGYDNDGEVKRKRRDNPWCSKRFAALVTCRHRVRLRRAVVGVSERYGGTIPFVRRYMTSCP